jgi:hypothetical protein
MDIDTTILPYLHLASSTAAIPIYNSSVIARLCAFHYLIFSQRQVVVKGAVNIIPVFCMVDFHWIDYVLYWRIGAAVTAQVVNRRRGGGVGVG